MKHFSTKGIRRSTYLTRDVWDALRSHAQRHRISLNEAVRRAVASYLDEHGDAPAVPYNPEA